MKNSENPINPTLIKFAENGTAMPVCEEAAAYGNYNTGSIGLTKREHFAGLALQALVTSLSHTNSDEYFAKRALSLADELLKQLENSK